MNVRKKKGKMCHKFAISTSGYFACENIALALQIFQTYDVDLPGFRKDPVCDFVFFSGEERGFF